MGRVSRLAAAAAALAVAAAFTSAAEARTDRAAWASSAHTVVVGYGTRAQLARALQHVSAVVVRTVPRLRVAELRVAHSPQGVAAVLARQRGIRYAEPVAPRAEHAEPALVTALQASYEWQFAASHEDAVPAWVLRAASAVTIAIVDTGADVTAPDLAAKSPRTYDVLTRRTNVRDDLGHGTFVASLAAGSVTNDEGIAGFGGDARLLVIRAGRRDGTFTDFDEAAAIVYAVDRGARVVNLSLGGPSTSSTEIRAIEYAQAHGVLLVAAAGNERQLGNPVEYPAALLQPVGSNGVDGSGLSVGASTSDGGAAAFSNTGSYLSLAAPGVDVFGAVSSTSSPLLFPRSTLPGSRGLYGFASGTSFAAPEVAGAAALVWAANPSLTAAGVAQILKQTASGNGTWSPDLGYGVIDVGAAVAEAAGMPNVAVNAVSSGGRVHVTWHGPAGATFRLSVARDSASPRVLADATTTSDAWIGVTAGHTYSFTVAALDVAGAQIAASTARVRVAAKRR